MQTGIALCGFQANNQIKSSVCGELGDSAGAVTEAGPSVLAVQLVALHLGSPCEGEAIVDSVTEKVDCRFAGIFTCELVSSASTRTARTGPTEQRRAEENRSVFRGCGGHIYRTLDSAAEGLNLSYEAWVTARLTAAAVEGVKESHVTLIEQSTVEDITRGSSLVHLV